MPGVGLYNWYARIRSVPDRSTPAVNPAEPTVASGLCRSNRGVSPEPAADVHLQRHEHGRDSQRHVYMSMIQGTSDQCCPTGAPLPPFVAVLVAVFCFLLYARCANAAAVSCVTTWGGGILDYTRDSNLRDHFPSGRRPSCATCLEALLKGEIVSGDFNKVISLVRANHPFLDRLLLWSPGGSVEEAMKIGRLVRKAMLVTQAPVGMGLDDGSGDLH